MGFRPRAAPAVPGGPFQEGTGPRGALALGTGRRASCRRCAAAGTGPLRCLRLAGGGTGRAWGSSAAQGPRGQPRSLCSPCSPCCVGEARGRPRACAGGVYTGCPGLLHAGSRGVSEPLSCRQALVPELRGTAQGAGTAQERPGETKQVRAEKGKQKKSVQQQMTQSGAAPGRAGIQQEVYQRQGRGRGAKRCGRGTIRCKGLQVRARCLSG